MSRTVLVTGAAGFIGSSVAGALLRRGDRVRGLDNLDPFYDPALKRRNIEEVRRDGALDLLEGDIRDPARVRAALAGCDAVIHLAAKAGVRPSLLDPVGYADVNVRGTAILLAEAHGAGVRTFVAASSSSVYGVRSKIPFHEDDPCDRPASPYAATKRAMEHLCASFQRERGMDLPCLRFFTAYGPRQRPEMAIHLFARAIGEGRPVTLFGDGGSRRDYTFIDDIVDGVLRTLDRAKGFRIYNLGESRTTSLAELVAVLEGALGRKAVIERKPDQPGDVPLTCADVSRARAELGYEPSTPLEAGVARFVEWLRRADRGLLSADRPGAGILDPSSSREIPMARWLVTGGAGFIGSNIVHRLAKDGERVRVLDDFSTGRRANLKGLPPRLVEVQEGDLRDRRVVARAVRGCEFVLHQGAIPSVPRSLKDPFTTTAVNVLGSVHVLEEARRARSVKRVVLASSSSVYGDTPTLPKEETMPLLPQSPYAASKAAMEGFARAFSASHGLEVCILRYFNVFGPRQDPRGDYAAVIPRFFHAVLLGKRPVIYGDGNQTRDFCFVDNVVEANLRAATAPRAAGTVLNVACGDRVTILGLASMIAECLGTTTNPRLEPGRNGEVRHSLASVERMEMVLGLRPALDLPRGLARAAEWYRSTVPGARKRAKGK